MAATTRPRTDAELRLLGVSDEVIRYRRSNDRVHVSEMRDVQVDYVVDENERGDLRLALARRLAQARRQFRRHD
jgi:hypothetical protein